MTPRLALVLPGGGARAAYQAGVLTHLARLRPNLRLDILTGTSAGAINAAHLAAHPGPFDLAVDRLVRLWRSIDVREVFRVDVADLSSRVFRWAGRLLSGGSPLAPSPRGLVDTTPLRRFLERSLETRAGPIEGIRRNLRDGRLGAVGVTTTDYGDGRSVTWCAGRDLSTWNRPHRRGVRADLTVDHVMASAALPLFFPAVRLGDSWHGDGDVRLTAPLSPALHLGADRILAISTRQLPDPPEPGALAASYPSPSQILGVLLDAIFLDNLEYDALQMERINRLVKELPPERREGLRLVGIWLFRPSRDPGALAGRHEPELPSALRFLLRGLGTAAGEGPEALSYLMFQRGYVEELLRLGEADARRREEELLAFVDGVSS